MWAKGLYEPSKLVITAIAAAAPRFGVIGRIEGPAFVYVDNDSGRVTTILGYPTDQLAQVG
jgi:hypothetical protein